MRLGLAILLVPVVAGCVNNGASQGKPVARLPLGVVGTLRTDDLCVYYQDYDTGDIYRVSMDGTVRERVLKGGKARGIRLALDAPYDSDRWRVNVGGLPEGSGYTVLDEVPTPASRRYLDLPTEEGLARVALSGRVSEWKLTFSSHGHEIDHEIRDYGWDSVTFSQGGKKATYDFGRNAANGGIVMLIDESHAFVFDSPNVIIWDLTTDQRTCITRASRVFVWPRNLHETDRFTPIAHGRAGKWEVKSADDVYSDEAH